MDKDDDEREFPDHHVFSRVLGMFDGNPGFQRILRLGLQAELDGANEEIYQIRDCSKLPIEPTEYLKASNWTSDGRFLGNYTRPANSVPVTNLNAFASLHVTASENKQAKETDSEKRGGVLQETKKYKGKAERKRLKKQRQKEKKRLDELEKEKQTSGKNEDGEDHTKECKTEKGKADNNVFKNKDLAIYKQWACGKDTDSSDCSDEDDSCEEEGGTEDDSGDFEELDMTSTFVSKAADIARRKLEQKPKPEKKRSPVKEEAKTSPDKACDKAVTEKKDPVTASSLTVEDNVRRSTELANAGNRSASSGDFKTAVKYFTDAIKFNPTEFKLFGNRSFCFEKMQEYEKALADAELSLSMRPGWVKGLFRKGRALAGLKRYNEASQAFREVLKLDGSYAEAAQELMRVQMTQLMGYGFTREQSSNALIIHGTVEKALEVLSKLNKAPGPIQNGALPPARVVNVSGVSPVLSATNPAPPPLPLQSQIVPKTPLKDIPVQNMSFVQSRPNPVLNQAARTNIKDQNQPQELFPVWVGNLFNPVSESDISRLFNKVGVVHSVKLLSFKRCAFVNYTKQEYCDEAIHRFHGFDLNGAKIAVRYPDRIPQGMGISRSALRADDLQDEEMRYEYGFGRNASGGRTLYGPYRHVSSDYKGNYKY
ncbi:uncharacterized protein LOC117807294 [Notolabrus celidotus]|uniref:uncharacterized protein LOC117807294 n=1 Tax=Notolabrus celidotus TaxID=1203425 RepID=UPI00149048A5|nr:uncharacterized protein LOC117807294 [Notolabrus celidotus]